MKFIVIDGLDGSGKYTQAKLLYEKYKKEGKNVVLRSHPSQDNKYGQKSKEALLKTGKINHLKATIYFGLDAIRSVHKYYSNKDIDVLIFSRYILAVVYLPNIINVIIYKFVVLILPTSPYMFFLDVSPEESLKRLNARNEEKEMFENKEELIKARNKSKKVLYNWNVISADEDPLIINKKISEICSEK